MQSGDLSLLIDPPNNRLKGDVVLRTSVSSDFVPSRDEIGFPGEYEFKKIEITGWQILSETTEKLVKTVYLVKWDEMNFVFLGKITKVPPIEVMENLDGSRMMVFLPISGGELISAKEAAEVVKQLEPDVVVPSFYQDPKDFLKLLGQEPKFQEKLVFKSKDFENKKNEVVLLKVS